MNEVIRAAAELQAFCVAESWRFCFIGGLAVLRWGEPRETVDVDLTLLTGFGGEDRFIDTPCARSSPHWWSSKRPRKSWTSSKNGGWRWSAEVPRELSTR